MVKNVLCWLFERAWKKQQIIMENSEQRDRSSRSVFIWAFPVGFLLLFVSTFIMQLNHTVGMIVLAISLIFVLSAMYSDAKFGELHSLTHLFSENRKPGFVKSVLNFIFFAFFLALVIVMVLLVISSNIDLGFWSLLCFWAVLIFPAVVYVWRSLLAKNDIVLTLNSVMSVIFFLLLEIKGYVLSFVPQNYVFQNEAINQLHSLGYSLSQVLDILLTTFLLPLFLIFACGTVFACAKQYWIKNYNCDRDIE